jgi:hypothetical protein
MQAVTLQYRQHLEHKKKVRMNMCSETFNLRVTAERVCDGAPAQSVMPCEVFSVAAIMAVGYAEENSLNGLQAPRQI